MCKYFFNCKYLGQLGVPFVSEHEHELRTPRPDLLDQPYAANYAGESYRRQVNKVSN